MSREEIIAAIDEEIQRLQQARTLLKSAAGTKLAAGAVHTKPKAKVKRILSEEARQRIAAGQKRRWAKQKKEAAGNK
jgi:hypothetical protein